MIDNIFLLEDHDEALGVWRRNKIKALDLVHIDAHIDFGFHPVKPARGALEEAGSLKELKKNLEKSIAFRYYEKSFDKQTNVANYIYPAMQEGIVKDFYWVIPGGIKEFKESIIIIESILKKLLKNKIKKIEIRRKEGIISVPLMKGNLNICTLNKLPSLKQRVLLDIDLDFLLISSLLKANNTVDIGKREPWILPKDLVRILKEKIGHPKIITVAYSVNGGYAPIRYRYLGDEIAYYFASVKYEKHWKNSFKAAQYFNLFNFSKKKEYYRKAVELNPVYRATDNNYGPLYLVLRKFSLAEKEFLKILTVDSQNPACLLGLGSIALEKKDFKKAKIYFSSALKGSQNELFSKIKNQSLLGLAQAELKLKHFKKAKELFYRYQFLKPLEPQSYYFLGSIYEKNKKFEEALAKYQDAIRLGLNDVNLLYRLLKITCHLKSKGCIIKSISIKYNDFKKYLRRIQRFNQWKGRKDKKL